MESLYVQNSFKINDSGGITEESPFLCKIMALTWTKFTFERKKNDSERNRRNNNRRKTRKSQCLHIENCIHIKQ